MIYGEYRSGIFKWAGAGHEHVLVKRKGGEVEIIRTGGVILGMVEDVGKYIEAVSYTHLTLPTKA